MNTINMTKRFSLMILVLFGCINFINAQVNVPKQCRDLLGEYEYGGQSRAANIIAGDTVRLNVILNNIKDYHVFACADEWLGEAQFRVVEKSKVYTKRIKSITPTTKDKYKTDASGNLMYDDNGGLISEGTVKSADTLWEAKSITNLKVLFNSGEGGRSWEITAKELKKATQNVTIEVFLPNAPPSEGNNKKSSVGQAYIMVGWEITGKSGIKKM